LILRVIYILFLIIGLGYESFGIQEKAIRVSPISIQWNAETRQFDTYYSVTNTTTRDVELTSIIIFKRNGLKRWRGSRLPVVKGKSEAFFKISNTAGLLLKNDYLSITDLVTCDRLST